MGVQSHADSMPLGRKTECSHSNQQIRPANMVLPSWLPCIPFIPMSRSSPKLITSVPIIVQVGILALYKFDELFLLLSADNSAAEDITGRFAFAKVSVLSSLCGAEEAFGSVHFGAGVYSHTAAVMSFGISTVPYLKHYIFPLPPLVWYQCLQNIFDRVSKVK